ncbi:MAG TPA: N-acetylmuramoyl-L-alanine amidase, partial [Chloroflexota bacterium]|nr:N-acetylmuramoyl-L-alanine amidase [Chloroflexota bacterium]
IQDDLVGAFRAVGDDTPDRGITADTDLVADLLGTLPGYHHLVVLGPGVPGLLNPSQMPGALCEPLFLSNPTEASAAGDPAVQQIIAMAFAQAIRQFLATSP